MCNILNFVCRNMEKGVIHYKLIVTLTIVTLTNINKFILWSHFTIYKSNTYLLSTHWEFKNKNKSE